ncbi:sarcoplasmic reticulum histidine-rich calcium-binding protein [Salvelinus sp. IW2-2015]|uniref:sarcoplasmic reticulum histidine-rich calcium-binding protein n=1 Tax=Salvelinus sp. IW2-2015 TaxID=2691554 RepID=UPI000CDF7EC3|nr:sushi domain-containing protein 5 [Salvelinus alpinus]
MMARRIDRNLVSLSMFGYLVWLTVVSVVHADGRVFLLDQRNTSDSGGLAEAEHACASHDARLASAEELRHAVVECSFSACTRGWLNGGSMGTTVCSNVGSALKAVDVKIENTTEDNTHLDVFCVKDKGVPCGDPPAFPNTHLQGHTGFEMGDELLYSCLPGHVLPSGHSAFSLLCDSCGEWYGLVQLCVKDKTEAHIDYEDKFTDDDHHLSYDTPTEEDTQEEPVEEEVQEETAYVNVEEDTGEEGHRDQEQQEASFSMAEVEEQDVETGGEEEAQGGEELSVGEEEQQEEDVGEGLVTGRKEEELEDSTDHPVDEEKQEEQEEGMGMSEATEAPVSLLSQKHLFWFPSEAFQEAGHVEPTHPLVTQDTPTEGDNRVRASGSESEESKEDNSQPEETKDHDSHEGQFQQPIDHNDHDDHEDDVDHEHIDREYDHDDQTDPDHDESSEQVFDGEDHVIEHLDHDDPDTHDGHEHDNHESYDSEEAHREDQGEHKEDDHEKGGRYDNGHDEHYNMGEHEEDDRIQYHSHGEHDDHEDHDHDDVTDHHDDDDHDHSDPSDHHDDHEDQDHVHDHDHLDDHEDQDHDDQDDHGHDDYDHDDHEDGHLVPPIGMTTGEPQNVTQEAAGGEPTASTDETWLDGYPVSQEETGTEKVGGGSTEEGVEPEVRGEEEEGLVVVRVTDRPNEVEMSRPIPFTGVPQVPLSPTQEVDPVEQDQDQVGGLSPAASPDLPLSPEATSSDSYSADYTTPSLTSSLDDVTPRNAARPSPTDSWETTDHVHPFLEHGPAPTAWTDDVIDEEERGAEHNLTRHSGEREGEEGEREGKTGEAGCTGGEEDCPPPPPPSSGRGPTVAAIVIAVCTVALAAAVGAWCYRRKQQKSSMYEMNGKGQSHSRHGQQIEMQQKV